MEGLAADLPAKPTKIIIIIVIISQTGTVGTEKEKKKMNVG